MDYVRFNFDETLKLLVVLSSSSEKQIEAMGLGHTEDEIANDFDMYFTQNKASFLKSGLLTKEQASILDKIDSYFEYQSNGENDEFWDGIETHEGWEELRSIAKQSLAMLGKEELDITITTNSFTSPLSGKIVSQWTKIELINDGT